MSGGAAGTHAGSSGESGSSALGGATGTSGAGGSGDVSGNQGIAGSPPDGCTQRKQQVGFASRRLFVAMDRSASLLENFDDTQVSTWDAVTTAFANMVRSPASDQLGVALRFFPHDEPTPGCSDPMCDFDACRNMLIPMATLASAGEGSDAHEAALLAALASSAPNADDPGGTPLYPALFGALLAAAEYQANVPDARATVVLVTDGAPNGCGDDLDSLLDAAQSTLQADGIATYVIGLPGTVNDTALELLAQFGGSVEPVYLPRGSSLAPDLEGAFTYLRDAFRACSFDLPVQYAGSTLNYDGAFVGLGTYGSARVAIPRLRSAADCGMKAGYTVDGSSFPDRLELCPASCEAAHAPGAMLEVLLDECPSSAAP